MKIDLQMNDLTTGDAENLEEAVGVAIATVIGDLNRAIRTAAQELAKLVNMELFKEGKAGLNGDALKAAQDEASEAIKARGDAPIPELPARIVNGFIFMQLRRENPKATLADARKVRYTELEFITGEAPKANRAGRRAAARVPKAV